MPKARPVALIALTLPLALPSTSRALPALVPLGRLVAVAAVSSIRASSARIPISRRPAPAPSLLEFAPGVALPSRAPKHHDLDDMVRDWVGGGRATFYVGQNLARGDISGVKTFGLKIYFD